MTVVKQKQNDGATNFCPCNPCDGFGMDAFFFCSAAPCAQHSATQRVQPLQPTLVVWGVTCWVSDGDASAMLTGAKNSSNVRVKTLDSTSEGRFMSQYLWPNFPKTVDSKIH